MQIKKFFLGIGTISLAAATIQNTPLKSKHIELLTFKDLSNTSLKPTSSLTSDLSFFFSNDLFTNEERIEIINSFCNLLKDKQYYLPDDLEANSPFEAIFSRVFGHSKFNSHENIRSSLLFMSKISSTIKSNMRFPVDYAHSLLDKYRKEDEFEPVSDSMNIFIDVTDALKENYTNRQDILNSQRHCNDLRYIANEIDKLRKLSNKESAPYYLTNNIYEMFSAYFNLMALLLVFNISSSVEDEEIASHKIANLLDTITQNTIGIILYINEPYLCNSEYNIFSEANALAFFELEFNKYFPLSELVHLRRDTLITRLGEIAVNALNGFPIDDLPYIELIDMKDLLVLILSKLQPKVLEQPRQSRFFSFFSFIFPMFFRQEVVFDDTKVNGVRRLRPYEYEKLNQVRKLVEEKLKEQQERVRDSNPSFCC